MVEIFLRQLRLEPFRGSQWVTVCIDLTSGLDLSNIDVSTVRLNESIAAAATVRQQDTLRLSFSRSDVHDVDQSQRLTITGRLTDGVGIRGAVQLE